MISYAQNFEDVMLWRAFRHVHKGFYVDIGAQDPLVDSVSRTFYESGWRGVHVEPSPAYAQALRDARPDESVLQVAIGETPGPMAFYDIEKSGLSTGDPALAEQHGHAGFNNTRIDVPCMRLSELLDSCGDRDIQWLKIDVEGMESSVIASWAPSAVRPWVLVVESTVPLSTTPSHGAWDALVTGLGYRFCYFDGLNRFYVAERHQDLAKAFTSPPNVFDNFAISGTASHSFGAVLLAAAGQAREDNDRLRAQQQQAQRDQEAARQDALASAARAAALVWQLEQARQQTQRILTLLKAQRHLRAAELDAARQTEQRLQSALTESAVLVHGLRAEAVSLQAEKTRLQAELASQQLLAAVRHDDQECRHQAAIESERQRGHETLLRAQAQWRLQSSESEQALKTLLQMEHAARMEAQAARHREQRQALLQEQGRLEARVEALQTEARAEKSAQYLANERARQQLEQQWQDRMDSQQRAFDRQQRALDDALADNKRLASRWVAQATAVRDGLAALRRSVPGRLFGIVGWTPASWRLAAELASAADAPSDGVYKRQAE